MERHRDHDPAMRGKACREVPGRPDAGIVHGGEPVAKPEQEARRVAAAGHGLGQQPFGRSPHHVDVGR